MFHFSVWSTFQNSGRCYVKYIYLVPGYNLSLHISAFQTIQLTLATSQEIPGIQLIAFISPIKIARTWAIHG